MTIQAEIMTMFKFFFMIQENIGLYSYRTEILNITALYLFRLDVF